jgi:hypothetical protein
MVVRSYESLAARLRLFEHRQNLTVKMGCTCPLREIFDGIMIASNDHHLTETYPNTLLSKIALQHLRVFKMMPIENCFGALYSIATFKV